MTAQSIIEKFRPYASREGKLFWSENISRNATLCAIKHVEGLIEEGNRYANQVSSWDWKARDTQLTALINELKSLL